MKYIYLFIILFFSVTFAVSATEPTKHSFTQMEVNHVKVATPGLFSGRNKFIIHLGKLKDNEFCYPLSQGKVISGYGTRRGHSGHDIKTRANDTIRSVFAGVVRMSKRYGAYGNIIVVRHDNGLESVYSHNSVNLVKSGDAVNAGQAIALTGRTGRATTDHLHFEFRINGQHFNPNLVLDIKNHSLRRHDIECKKEGSKVVVKSLN